MISFVDARRDPNLFGRAFPGDSWSTWDIVAKAIDGLPLTADGAGSRSDLGSVTNEQSGRDAAGERMEETMQANMTDAERADASWAADHAKAEQLMAEVDAIHAALVDGLDALDVVPDLGITLDGATRADLTAMIRADVKARATAIQQAADAMDGELRPIAHGLSVDGWIADTTKPAGVLVHADPACRPFRWRAAQHFAESTMNAKRKGTRNEHRSKALLEGAGYAVCRAAASLGVWDLIGISATGVVLCQVKTRDWPGSAEMETLRAFPVPANGIKLVHRWRDRQRLPDVRQVGP